MINKVTPRSRNSSTDKRYVTPDQYTEAVNIRVENSFSESGENASGNVGVIKPVKGTVLADGSALTNHVVLGKVLDTPTNTVYFAAASTNASQNGVFKIDPVTSAVSPVVTTKYFAWDGVSHVDMAIARSRNGGAIVYLTDGVNAPYKVDVEFFNENPSLVSNRMYDAITVCPGTPNKPITGNFTFDASSKSSNFKNLPGLQFAYQNIYETGEISALSSYSDVLVPPSYITQGAGTLESLDSFNRIDLTIPGQPWSVKTVKLLLRFGDDGSWFIIKDIERSDAERQALAPVSVSFYNDEILPQLPADESKRAFDSVPIYAATNEVQEDRLFYGNYSEGRDNVPEGSFLGATQANLSVIYEDRPDDFDPISLDIEPEVISLRRKDDNGNNVDNNYCHNRVAGFRLNLGSDGAAVIPGGSTVVFDFTCAPDKNFHIYESTHSFHANREEYRDDSNTTDSHNNYNKNALSPSIGADSEYNWLRATWGFSDQALKTGVTDGAPANFRYGVSDEVISGNTAQWRVRKGPLSGDVIPVVYGSSPASPLILRGGEISFSVKFRLLQDLTVSQIIPIIVEFLDEKPYAGYEQTVDPATGDIVYNQLVQPLDNRVRGGYSIDMGAGTGRRRFARNSSAADVITCVGDRGWATSFVSSTTQPEDYAPNPCGFFMVDKADVEFKLRDVTNIDNVAGVVDAYQDDSFYLTLDITSVDNLNIVTMIPVFELTTDGSTLGVLDPLYRTSRSKWVNRGEHEGYSGTYTYGYKGVDVSAGGSSDHLYPIHHGNVVNAWVSFGDNDSWENIQDGEFNTLFDCLYESTAGPSYKKVIEFQNQDTSFQESVESYVIPGGNNYNPLYANLMRWFGTLEPAYENAAGPSVGLEGAGGSFTATGTPRQLIHTYQSALTRAIDSGEFTGTADGQTYANYAFSMVDGEGGIGGWKGSLLQNAEIICKKLIDRSKETNLGSWDGGYTSADQVPFQNLSPDQFEQAFSRFTGKIEGSAPSSIIFTGKIRTSIRFVADDRVDWGAGNSSMSGDWQGTKGFYPDIPIQAPYGPVLAGLYFPFQYLHTGGVNIENSDEGVVIEDSFYLNGFDQSPNEQDEFIVVSYNDPGRNSPSVAWDDKIAGYLTISGEEDEDSRPSSVEMISDNTYILSSNQGAADFRSFKRSSNHSLGMVYYDYFGRPGTVIPFPSVYVGGYSDAELPAGNAGQGTTKIKVDFSLSNIPDWAYSYKFVYGGNSTTDEFIQYTAGGAFVAVNTEEGEQDQVGNIYVSLNYLQSNPDVSYANAFGAVSDLGDKNLYKFSGGDRLKVLSYFEGDDLETRQFPVNYEFDVVDVTTLTGDPNTNPLWNIEDGDQVPKYLQGQFVVVKNNPTASMFTYASVRNGDNQSATSAHRWNNRAVIELYKPKSKREEGEIVYREIGPSFRVVNIPTVLGDQTYYQKGHEYSSHIISQGDVWFRRIAMNIAQYKDGEFKGIIRASNASAPRFLDYYVESKRFTDQFADSKSIGLGKAVLYSPEAKQLEKPSSIIFSNINTRSSRYNRLSTFDATSANFKEIPNDHGAIKIMVKDGDSLAVFQESKLSMLPVNRSILADASSNASLIASSKTIGNQVFIAGNFGVGDNPESVVYVDGFIYFANPRRKEVYRYTPGKGVQTISDAGMEDYFEDLFSGDPKRSKVVAGFDYKNEEFLIYYDPLVSEIVYSSSDAPAYPLIPTLDGVPGTYGSEERTFVIPPSANEVSKSPTPQPQTIGDVLSRGSLPSININTLSKQLQEKINRLIRNARPSYRSFRSNTNSPKPLKGSFFKRRAKSYR